MTLSNYLPHIHATGNELVVCTSNVAAVPEIVLKRAQSFVLNTSYYLANRREVRQIDWTEMGLTVSRQLEDAPHEARFLNDLGLVYAHLGDNARGLDYFEQALPLQRAVGDRSGQAATLSNIGAVYTHLGDNARALDCFEQALPLQRVVGDRSGQAAILSNIGSVYSALGDKARGLDYFEQALPLCRAVGNRSDEAAILSNIGSVYADLGDKARGTGLLRASAAPVPRCGQPQQRGHHPHENRGGLRTLGGQRARTGLF